MKVDRPKLVVQPAVCSSKLQIMAQNKSFLSSGLKFKPKLLGISPASKLFSSLKILFPNLWKLFTCFLCLTKPQWMTWKLKSAHELLKLISNGAMKLWKFTKKPDNKAALRVCWNKNATIFLLSLSLISNQAKKLKLRFATQKVSNLSAAITNLCFRWW